MRSEGQAGLPLSSHESGALLVSNETTFPILPLVCYTPSTYSPIVVEALAQASIDHDHPQDIRKEDGAMSTRHTEDQTSSRDAFDALYEQCLEAVKKRLEHTTTLTAEVLQSTAYAVRNHFMSSMEGGQEPLNQAIDTLVKQWQQVLMHGNAVRQDPQVHDTLHDLTERGVSLLAHLAGTIQTMAGEVEEHLQRELAYHTGAVVGAGNFFCTQCDKDIHKVKAGPLPPCSRCHRTVFRRRFSNAVGF